MEDKTRLLKLKDITLTVRELVSASLANGMPLELIAVAARVTDYSWADIASLASQAYAFKARKEGSEVARLNELVRQSKLPEDGVSRAADLAKMEAERVKSASRVGEFDIFSRRLRGEEVVNKSADGRELRLGPPSPKEMQEMFGVKVLQAGRGKPDR